mgnify:CR=1 FL=1
MERTFINENGSRRTPAQLIAALRREEQLSLCNGSACSEGAAGNGHRCGWGHIDSFCQVYEALCITMAPGQRLSWRTAAPGCAEALIDPSAKNGAVIVFEYAMGNGAAYPQPNGYFELSVDGAPQLRFSMKKSSWLFENEKGVRLYLEVKRKKAAPAPGGQFTLDEFIQNESVYVNGRAYLYLPQSELRGRTGLTLSVAAQGSEEGCRRWFRVGFNYFVLAGDLYGGLDAVLNGRPRPVLGGRSIYFGDIHVHTAQSGFLNGDGCGTGTVEANLAYARDVAGLDFCAITDHDWQLDAADWQLLRATNEQFNQNGRFVALNAYEWTSANYGHRNVYFRSGCEIPPALKPFDYQAEPYEALKYGVSTPHDPTPQDLWDWLEENRFEAITIPHHPNSEQFLMDFSRFYNERYDRCVEIYSSWGCMFAADHPLNLCSERVEEYGYQRYAGRFHFGFVASSDGHDGNAGDANLTHDKHHLAHYAGSGHVAVLADELTREAVYDALKARHCYAVTGEPMLLRFTLGGAIMGDRLAVQKGELPVEVEVQGTFPLTRLTLYKNGQPWRSLPTGGGERALYRGELPGAEPAVYWVEALQADGEYAWSSPITVTAQ